MKAGDRLKIPDRNEPATEAAKPSKNETKPAAEQNKKNDEKTVVSDTAASAIKHKIKSGDNLESVAQKYNCSVEDILELNPFLTPKSKLKKGQYLTIFPDRNNLRQAETLAKNKAAQDTAVAENQYSTVNFDCENLYSGDTLNVVLILPINTSLLAEKSAKNQHNIYDFIEFYEGFLLAADSLRRNNISINLTTFDVYDSKTLNAAVHSEALDKARLIVGHL